MRLYLVQHGQAKAEEEDPERPLTDQGAEDVSRVAAHSVGRLGVTAARVVHSGKTRARQTAEIWAGLLGAPAEQGEALSPNDDPATWAGRVERETDDLVLVGHLPHLGRLAGLLLTRDADRAVVAFRPGGLVGLEGGASAWAVTVALPPEAV